MGISKSPVEILIAIIVYVVLMIVIGVVYYKRNKGADDYFLGGRGLGPWVCAMSAEASDMSGWLLMGLPGVAYAIGIGEAFWTAVGLALGTYLNWLLVAKRLRSYTIVAKDSITLPDFFSNRFHDKKKILMIFSGLFIVVFFTIYTATGFKASGTLFQSIFGLDSTGYVWMVIASAFVIVFYTAVGGFLAESTTDFIQGILMFISLIIVLAVGIAAVGGIGQVSQNLSGINNFFSVLGVQDLKSGGFTSYSALDIISNLAWGLGYFGMPHVLLRFMAIRSTKELGRSRRIAMIWVVISLGVAVMIGVVGRALLGDSLLTNAKQETVFIEMAIKLMPAFIAGIMLSGILAATMSTADSQLLVTSSAVSNNFYRNFIRRNASDKEVMWVGRIVVIIVAIVGVFMALDSESTIFGLVKYAWGGFGAAFGPVILFSLFWKRTTFAGALSGMVVGGATVIVWKEVLSKLGGIFGVYELLPAFILASLVIIVVSLCTKAPSKEVEAEFEAAKTMALE
jgi:sodium/proline symporter